ncbi:MAG: universal stress protein [Hyphomicrobiaceae bacterium]
MPHFIIVVPVDGSEPSMHAVDHAVGLAQSRSDAEIVLVNVQNLALLDLGDAAAIMPPDWETKAMEQAAKTALVPAQRRAAGKGIAVAVRQENGPVAETIARLAEELGATQIVMGTRGLGGVRGLFMGSVATQLVHLSKVPVTLVK